MAWQVLNLWKIIPSEWLTCWRIKGEKPVWRCYSNWITYKMPWTIVLNEWDMEGWSEYDRAQLSRMFSLPEDFFRFYPGRIVFYSLYLHWIFWILWRGEIKHVICTDTSGFSQIRILFIRKFENASKHF